MLSHSNIARLDVEAARPVPRVRRTQEQRTEAMRAKLIQAAIDCLYRLGYAETTTALVAATAGASRGAMLHHFPSKDDLFQAVVEYALQRQIHHNDQRLKAIDDPVERFLSLPTIAWEFIQAPEYVAWMEIWMATRSHPELRVHIHRAYDAVEADFVETILNMAREAGARDATRVNTVRVILRAALRGLAAEAAIDRNPAQFAHAIDEMRHILADVLTTR